MKQYYLIILLLLCGCQKGKEQNANSIFVKTFTPQQLRQDIDYVRDSLTQKQPNLYWYISRAKLDYKFDSLKNAINTPLTAPQFRIKLLQVLSSIGDGHISLLFNEPKIPPADMLFFNGDKAYPIQQLAYKIINSKLYVLKNSSGDNTLLPGAEILSIDNKPASELIKNFSDEWPSDGYNQTYKIGRLNLNDFPSRYYFTYGLKDQLTFTVKQHGSIKTCKLSVLTRPKPKSNANGVITSSYYILSRQRTAYIMVAGFVNASDPFVNLFKTIKEQGVKYLVIDLRNNMGGNVVQMGKLFGHLIGKPTYFYKTKMGDLNNAQKTTAKLLDYGSKTPILPDSNHFEGKVYVMINGVSFSAAALLAANLQVNRAVLVGEETGGGRNGCTAGITHESALPNSGLLFRFGLIQLKISPEAKQYGRGVMPDVPIVYTINDYLNETDLEDTWIYNDIKAKGAYK
ncbi:S41 family peptidase [Mucilaginibacter sp. UYCu711]|uniref:S41 family peptidase n=1 Tax=Mucilaginibacter sp. UYCu711 TaxID=3156339 RepID=UPI003D221D6E